LALAIDGTSGTILAVDKSGEPLGLAEQARVIKPVKTGEYLTYDNCVPDDSLIVTQIRKRLDQADARFHNAA
jgi:predicted homoserine dehydrogenase-like protein